MPPQKLKGFLVTLKQLEKLYIPHIFAMFSSTVRQALNISSSGIDETTTFVENKLKEVITGITIYYVIFDNADQCLIGAVEIRPPDYEKGQLGAWINEAYWGGGRYQEALDLIIKTYFTWKPRAQDVGAQIHESNIRSLRAHQKYGFVITGILERNERKFYTLTFNRSTLNEKPQL